MSKRYKTNKLHTMVDQLHKVIRLRCDDSGQAQAQIDYYVRNGYLTRRMKDQAKEIIDRRWDELKPKRLQKRHFLYAASNGSHVKIGMSSSVESRVKTLQTASPVKLELLWQCYAGEDDKEAKRQERKLHTALRKYKIRSEWFSRDCMGVVDGWRVKSRQAKDEEIGIKMNEELDREFMSRL